MKTNIFSRIALATVLTAGALSLGSCDDFLDHQKPQGTLDETQVKDPSRIDNLVISAYAVYMSAEDVNSSFSMWNFDVRSDDAYKGGNGTSDGDVFHQLEISQGILTTNWNISDMWTRLYNCISRVCSTPGALPTPTATSPLCRSLTTTTRSACQAIGWRTVLTSSCAPCRSATTHRRVSRRSSPWSACASTSALRTCSPSRAAASQVWTPRILIMVIPFL